MKICDKCGSPATDRVIMESSDESFDVCQTHAAEVRAIFQNETDEPKQEDQRRGGPGKRNR